MTSDQIRNLTNAGPAPAPTLAGAELERALRHYVQGFGTEPTAEDQALLRRDGYLDQHNVPTPDAYMAVQLYEDRDREARLAAGQEIEDLEGPVAGDRLRAHDFEPREGRGDCYVEGPVVLRARAQGVDWVFLTCERDVWDGKLKTGPKSRTGQVIRTPLLTTFDWDGRLEVLAPAPAPDPEEDPILSGLPGALAAAAYTQKARLTRAVALVTYRAQALEVHHVDVEPVAGTTRYAVVIVDNGGGHEELLQFLQEDHAQALHLASWLNALAAQVMRLDAEREEVGR